MIKSIIVSINKAKFIHLIELVKVLDAFTGFVLLSFFYQRSVEGTLWILYSENCL